MAVEVVARVEEVVEEIRIGEEVVEVGEVEKVKEVVQVVQLLIRG
jgi:transcription elongation factor